MPLDPVNHEPRRRRRLKAVLACIVAALVQCNGRAEAACEGWNVPLEVRLLAEMNRDGRADVIAFGARGVWTSLAQAEGGFSRLEFAWGFYGGNQGWSAAKHVRLATDLNGDGDADIVGFGKEGVWTSLGGVPGLFSAPVMAVRNYGADQGWRPDKHVRVMANVDHDRRPDVVGFGTEGVWVSTSIGDGRFRAPEFVMDNYGTEHGWTPAEHVRLMADISGDGLADIVGFGTEGVWTSLAIGQHGVRFTTPVLAVDNYGKHHGWTPAKHVRTLADISGDGLPDIVGFGDAAVWTSLSMGNGHFISPLDGVRAYGSDQGWTPDRHVRELADINGDGKADIVGFGNQGVWTSLATVEGRFAAPTLALYRFGSDHGWTPANSLRALADINGDRRADILAFGSEGLWTALAKGDGGFENPRSACGGSFDFNLVWPSGQTDPNGFPLNPRWSWQQEHPGADPPSAGLCHYFSREQLVTDSQGQTRKVKVPDFADCTNQSGPDLVDTPDGFNAFICGLESSKGFYGHVNWFPATFTGELFWGDHNADDDYYMPLTTEGAPAVINEPGGSRREQHTEFDTDETVDYFDTPWWNRFNDAVDEADGDKAKVRQFLTLADGSRPYAIMTGLFGLDLEHDGGKSELHPVYALAARVARETRTEAWAMFVRNWGNEGYCSRKNWPVELTTYKFHLPWRAGAQSVKVLWGVGRSVFAGTEGTSGPEVDFTPGLGIDVVFRLPRPSLRPLIEGELHLEWVGPLQPPVPIVTPHIEREEEREPLQVAMDRLTRAQRAQVSNAAVPVPPAVGALSRLPEGRAARAVSSLPEPPATAPRQGTPEVAARKLSRDEARFKELCRVTNNSPVGLPDDACRSFDPGPEPCARERALVASAQSRLDALLAERKRLQAELAVEQSPAVKKKIMALIADLNVRTIPAARRELAAAEALLAACH